MESWMLFVNSKLEMKQIGDKIYPSQEYNYVTAKHHGNILDTLNQ
jgi:hypothetical protein